MTDSVASPATLTQRIPHVQPRIGGLLAHFAPPLRHFARVTREPAVHCPGHRGDLLYPSSTFASNTNRRSNEPVLSPPTAVTTDLVHGARLWTCYSAHGCSTPPAQALRCGCRCLVFSCRTTAGCARSCR